MKPLIVPILTGATVLGLVAFAAIQERGNGPAIERKRREARAALAAAIQAHEAWLDRESRLQQAGASSELEVNFIGQNLALLRHDLALADKLPEVMTAQSRELVGLRETHLNRMLTLHSRGAVQAATVDRARRRLASARYLLATEEDDSEESSNQLESIIQNCNSELARAERAAAIGGVSSLEVGEIRARLLFARYLLAREIGSSSESLVHLRSVIAERGRQVSRIQKLIDQGASDRTALIEARHSQLWAEAALAIECDYREQAQTILRRLVESAKEQLAYLKNHPEVSSKELMALVTAGLRDYELRLEQAGDPGVPLASVLRRPLALLDN